MVVLNLALSMRLIKLLLLLACLVGFVQYRTNVHEASRVAAEYKTLATPYFLNGTWHFSGDPKEYAAEISDFRWAHPELQIGKLGRKPGEKTIEVTFTQSSPRS